MTTPSVSILLPVLDEIEHIDACLRSLLAQDHEGAIEILIAEGGSTDGTAGVLAARAAVDGRIRVVSNPGRVQSLGLNALIERATGDICVRADAHTTYAPDYVTRNVAAVVGGATLAGGPMVPIGHTRTERAVAAAMRSPIAAGPAPFRSVDRSGTVDTVYLGAMRTADLRSLGGYRNLPSGVAEDADLAARVRASGGTVILDPAIRSEYRPRSSLRRLWRQFYRYGRGKAEMLYLHHRLPTLRPLAPTVLVLGLVAGTALGILSGVWWPVMGITISWVLALATLVPAGGILTPVAGAVMHLSYGIGFVAGLITGRRRTAAVRGPGPAPGS